MTLLNLSTYVEQHCHEICEVDAGLCEVEDGGSGDYRAVKCPDTRPTYCGGGGC